MSYWSRNDWIEHAKEQALKNAGRTDSYVRGLMDLYDEAAYTIEKEINALFARFAKDNNLTDAQASKLLSGKEYSVWKKSIEKYIQSASSKAKGSKTLLELNTLAMKSRISQKEKLLAAIYQAMMELAGDCETQLDELLGDMVEVNYYETCYAIQQSVGMGFSTAKLSKDLIRQVLEYPWSEKHYSENVWGYCDHLSSLVRRELTLGLIQGTSVQKMARAINEVMDRGRYNAERLVRTECKYFSTQGEIIGYQENRIDEYRFIGGTEGCVICTCASLNGRVFKVTEAVAGVNLPPIHPNCLCITVAHFAKSLFDDRRGEPLDQNIKFQDWKKKYVSDIEIPAFGGIMSDIKFRYPPITDEAIEKVPLVIGDVLEENVYREIQKRNRELLRYVQDDPPGTEGIYYCDLTGKLITRYKGTEIGKVPPSRVSGEHISIHNHPDCLIFSHPDIENFLESFDMKIMAVIANNGTVYMAEKADDYEAAETVKLYAEWKNSHPDLEKRTVEYYINCIRELLKNVEAQGISFIEKRP